MPIWNHGSLVRRWLVMLLGTVVLFGCEEPDADAFDMRVDDDAVMDTTPAGTPAPPSLPSVAEAARRELAVTLDEWSVVVAQDSVPAGEVTFHVANVGSEPHSLRVEGVEGGSTPPVPPGGAESFTMALEPGTYRLTCPDTTDGRAHAEMGMSSAIIVR